MDIKSIPILLPTLPAGAVAGDGSASWNITAQLAERGVAVGSGGARITRISPIVRGFAAAADSTTEHSWSITFDGGAALEQSKTGQAAGVGSMYNHEFDATWHESRGTGGTFTKAGSTVTFRGTDAEFSREMVGQPITIAGATTGGNNGTFTITAYVEPTATVAAAVSWSNASGAAEAFAGTYAAGQVNAVWPSLTPDPDVVAVLEWTGPDFYDLGGHIWVTIEYDGASCPTHTRFLDIPQHNFEGPSAWCNSSTFTQVGNCQRLLGVTAPTWGIAEDDVTIVQDYLRFRAHSGGIPDSLAYGASQVRVGGSGGTTHTFSDITVDSGMSFLADYIFPAPDPNAAAIVEAKVGAGLGGLEYFFPGGVVRRLVVFTCDRDSAACTVVGQRYVGNASGELGTAEADAKVETWDVFVPEVVTASGPISYVQFIADSAPLRMNARLATVDAAGATVVERTAREQLCYRMDSTGIAHEVGFRLDAGGGAGTAIALERGVNRYRAKLWSSSTEPQYSPPSRRQGTAPCGIFSWAYNCATPAGGLAAVATIVYEVSQPIDYIPSPSEGARFMSWTAHPPAFDDDEIVVVGAGVHMAHHENNTSILGICTQARSTLEAAGQDQVPLYNSHAYHGYQKCDTMAPLDATGYYPTFPGETPRKHGGLTPSRSRSRHFTCGNGSRVGVRDLWCTARAVRTVSIAVTGYAGDGSGIEVAVFRADTREIAATVTTAAGGTATMRFLDDTVGGTLDSTIGLFAAAAQGLLAGASPVTLGSSITVPFPALTTRAEGAPYNRGFDR